MPTQYLPERDRYGATGKTAGSFGDTAVAIVPSDTVDLADYPKAIMCTKSGTLVCLPMKGTDGTYITIDASAGMVIPFRIRRIQATGTTGTYCTIGG